MAHGATGDASPAECLLMWDIGYLFIQHAREIDRFLRRRGHSVETSADLTHDTFVRLLSAGHPGSHDNPKAYLHRVARNLSIDLLRRERHVRQVSLPDEEFRQIADLAPSQETIVYDRQRLAIIERALTELPDKTRQAFELHRLDGLTINQVAAEIGLSQTRSWVLIRQAYQHLRSRLKDDSL